MGNKRKSKEGLPLEPGITVIGERKGMYKGEPVVFTIYYGNLVLPMIDGEFKHLSLEKYEKMLHDFLYESEDGQKYAVATEEEKRKAIELVLEKEPEMAKDMCPQETEEPNEKNEKQVEQKEIRLAPSYEAIIQEIETKKTSSQELHEDTTEIYMTEKQKERPEPVQQKAEENTSDSKFETKVRLQTVIIAVQFVLICLLCILLLRG